MEKSVFIQLMQQEGWGLIVKHSLYPPPKQGNLFEGYINNSIFVNKDVAIGVFMDGVEFIKDFDDFLKSTLLAHKWNLTEDEQKKIRYD